MKRTAAGACAFLIAFGFAEAGAPATADRDALGYWQGTRSYRVCAEGGVRVVDYPAERSFAAVWVPPDYRSGRVMVLLHGTDGTAYDELKDELPSARKNAYMLVALQWLDRASGRYFDANTVHRLIERALHETAVPLGADPDRAALSGFSRGGAVSYETAWLDAGAHRHFKLVICISGGVPNDSVVAPGESHRPGIFFAKLNTGALGSDAMKGCRFFLYSGDRDEEWGDRMSAQMAHAQKVLPTVGAEVVEWIREPNGGHMGYRTIPGIQEKAVAHFLRLTGGAAPPSSAPAGSATGAAPPAEPRPNAH